MSVSVDVVDAGVEVQEVEPVERREQLSPLVGVRHVEVHVRAAGRLGRARAQLVVHVEQRDGGARVGQRLGGGAPDPDAAPVTTAVFPPKSAIRAPYRDRRGHGLR